MANAARRRQIMALSNRLQGGLVLGALAASALLFVCAVAFYAVEVRASERVETVVDGFLWVTRTLLQGEPPWEAVTGFGQFLFYVVVVTGVGLVALGTGAVATKLIEIIRRRDTGMGDARYLSGHIVICGWSAKGAEILKELHAQEVEDKRPVVILADLPSNPSGDDLTVFVRGNPSNAADLHRAAIEEADTAIVLADETNPSLSVDDIDAKTLLATLAVESINPRVHTCVEVIRSENKQHFQRAKADELVVSAELTGALLASSAVTHGISYAVSDLLTHPGGTEFYSVPVPDRLAGSTFGEALATLKERHDCILVAVGTGPESFEINPSAAREIRAGERLLVVATKEPNLDGSRPRTRKPPPRARIVRRAKSRAARPRIES